MSSTTAGRDEGAREDELDLGREDADFNETFDRPPLVDEEGDLIESFAHEPLQRRDDIHEKEEKGVSPSQQGHPANLVNESASIPDDTPSLHGSLLSSQSSRAVGLPGSPIASPSPSHRPFDLRFQSRLSSSYLTSPRSSSPLLDRVHHSRQSSFASQASSDVAESEAETEAPSGPWDIVQWTRLRKITNQAFSEAARRNFGRPTCMAVSTNLVLGTSKGIILVFDYHQSLKCIIGPGTKAVECGAITSLAISADHSTVAGGHASGNIFTWEISRSAKQFLYIPPIPIRQIDSRTSDGHVSGASVVHIGFLGTRRTALVSADERGMAFSHLATRGMGAVGRTVKTTRILGRYPQTGLELDKPRKPSSVLAFSPLPLGNVERSTDSLGLVAMLTPYLLVIVSTTPIAQTQHKVPRPTEVAAHGAMTAALAWFPAIKLKANHSQTSRTKLAYCWTNVLTVLEVVEAEPDGPTGRGKLPILLFRARSRWKADEAIVSVQWLSRSVLAVLTITQQLLILEDNTMRITDSIDLINRHIYHVDLFSSQLHTLVEQLNEEDTTMHGVVADAFYMSFRAFKGRLFLLGYNEVLAGSLSNWADRLLALVEVGEFIGAIRLATSYYSGSSEKLTIGLPEDDAVRHPIVLEKLLEMITASLKYAFGTTTGKRVDNQQLEQLAQASIVACVCTGEKNFLWDELFDWYEDNEGEGIFLNALEPYIIDGSVRSLPPAAVKALIHHYMTTHTAAQLEEIICLLETSTMDIDQMTTLCKQYNLYDAYIYVWNRTLGDYVTPLQELLSFIPSHLEPMVNGNTPHDLGQHSNAMKIFPYLSFVLTGRIYPTGEDMEDAESSRAKSTLYRHIFSGNLDLADGIADSHARESFSDLRKMLKFDTPSFMSMLNEAFEDSFLNEQGSEVVSQGLQMNRQYLIRVLLQVMGSPLFTSMDTVYLDMFVARNLPKYPQYVLLPGTTLHQVLVRLCKYPTEEMREDCELSAEYLLSMYHPPDIQTLMLLFKEARFFRILKSTLRSEKQYSQLVLTYLEDPNDQPEIFAFLQDCLRPGSGLTKKQRRDLVEVIKAHAAQLAAIDVTRAAQVMQDSAPEVHETFLKTLEIDTRMQFQYLAVLIEPQSRAPVEWAARKGIENWMIERYVQLLCRYNPSRVTEFVDSLREGDVRLEELLPAIEESGIVNAAVVLLARQGKIRDAMDRLIAHIGMLEAGLLGILQSADESPDSASTDEAIGDLLESLDKYARVGIWLCQSQTKAAKKQSRAVTKVAKRGKFVFDQPLSFDETLWLDLIDGVVRIASNVFGQMRDDKSGRRTQQTDGFQPQGGIREEPQLASAFRALVQQVFTGLLSSTIVGGIPTSAERTDTSFLRILRAFLTRAATWSTSLLELRAVLASIFSAYTYQKSLLSLANGMLDRDLFVHVAEVIKLRQRGWRPRSHGCEICQRRVWGPGVGAQHWQAWEKKQDEERRRHASRRLSEDEVDDLGKGKGKGIAVHDDQDRSYHPEDHSRRDGPTQGNSDAADDDDSAASGQPEQLDPAIGPVVVFSCRHIYHRRCLLDAEKSRHSQSMEEWPAGYCPACT